MREPGSYVPECINGFRAGLLQAALVGAEGAVFEESVERDWPVRIRTGILGQREAAAPGRKEQ